MAQPPLPTRFDQGISLALGEAGPPDLAAARQEFAAGASDGDVRAAHALAGFLAGGIGGPRDWQAAVDLLRLCAPRDGLAAMQTELISEMGLTADGLPASLPELKAVHSTKRISVAERLLSPKECEFLIRIATPMLLGAKVISVTNQIEDQKNVRDNDHCGFAMLQEPPAIRAINLRVAAVSATDVRQGEPLQIMRYREGQQYRTHLDRISAGTNQRLMTAIIYLNDDFSGGETGFPVLDMAVRGRRGDALLFRNLTEKGEVDRDMQHAGLPPTGGVKFIASRWILERPAYDEQGNLLGETLWS